ncbi:MAG: hypothetical protein V5A88_09390 [Candidatus Thermoplasmatota archaeon]
MDKKKKLAIILGIGVAISLLLTFLFLRIVPVPTRGPRNYFDTFLGIKVFISSFTLILLAVLLWNYISIYREMPNRFTLSLIIVSLALLLYALFSNPFVPLILGFKHGIGLGPFTFLPDLFAATAVTVLLYQSYE